MRILLLIVDRKDNFNTMKEFGSSINAFYSDILEMKFYCQNRTAEDVMSLNANNSNKYDHQNLIMVKEGKKMSFKQFKYLSKKYLDFLFNKFNLTEQIEKRTSKSKIKLYN